MKRTLKFIAILGLLLTGYRSHGAPVSPYIDILLPKPQKIIADKEECIRVDTVSLIVPDDVSDRWHSCFKKHGVVIDEVAGYPVKAYLVEKISDIPDVNEEAYSLYVTSDSIRIEALTPTGLHWALMTIEQLVQNNDEKLVLPQCHIVDWPAFPVRGVMIDCGRSYIPMEVLKRVVKEMSRFKMNTFHWHLTENQAWRLESKIYPTLNDSSNMTRHKGKYYTIEEAKEFERWCIDHNVTLIPEIDMPGHAGAFERTFGFDMQSPEGKVVLKDLIEECCVTFGNSRYLHIGTDETVFTDSVFVPEMVEFVRRQGKKAVSWNPGWNYKPGEIDMTHMWSYRGEQKKGIPAVDSRFHYLNHFDIFADLVSLYRSNIYHKTEADDDIKGMIICLWNDRRIDDDSLVLAENNLYANLMAAAERTWTGGGTEYFDSLGTNLVESEVEDFNQFNDFERRLLFYKSTLLKDQPVPYIGQTHVKWLITDPFHNCGDLEAVFPPEVEGLKETYNYKGEIYKTKLATGAGIYLRHVWGASVPAFYADPQPNSTAYVFTKVYAPEDITVGVLVETQNYSRSESDLPPPQDEWDYRKSRIWVNGQLLSPPVWSGSIVTRDAESLLTNENFSARPPLALNLHKGWNTVLLKLPVGMFTTDEVRLVKWMFTFVFTTPDGSEAYPGLIYDPFAL